MTIEIIIGLVSLIGGFLMGYFTSFFKEKGKNKALIQDLKRMTEETEKVTSKFELDISKRKYKYEDKREQYFKYFNLLDSLSTEGNKDVMGKFLPALTKFNTGFLGANENKKKELKATTDFSESVGTLLFKANENLLKIKQETNTIRIIAGEKVLKALNELETAFDVTMVQSSNMMKEMSDNVINGRVDILSRQQDEMAETGRHLVKLKENLMLAIRAELDEI